MYCVVIPLKSIESTNEVARDNVAKQENREHLMVENEQITSIAFSLLMRLRWMK